MKTEILKVLESYRVTIPRAFREEHGVKLGDHVKVVFMEKINNNIVANKEFHDKIVAGAQAMGAQEK